MQMSQLATSVSERERGTFPSQPIPNPNRQNPNSNQIHIIQDSNVSHLNAVTTLRSGKKIDNHVVNPNSLPDDLPNSTENSTNSDQNIEPISDKDHPQTQVAQPTELSAPFSS